ncbi:MAG: UbiA prenyltransferase family protein [Candidatus Thermoplasmatota archaeon]|jgi:4-hydroxybenzoate polyprenyltransferase|nr:UbiA prenyltransferase family protein [Candidatus Thermoplasmatota archaeon]
MNKISEFARLIRPYGLLFLGLTPVFSAIFNGMFDFFYLFILFLIGSLSHIFIFVQNDYFDVEVDKKSIYVSKRPLIVGSISKKEALLIVVLSFLLSIILVFIFIFKIMSFIFLLLSFFFFSMYNKYSKKNAFMEYVLSAGVFTFGLFGAFSVNNTISDLAIIFCFFASIQWLFSVGVFANFKDVEYDTKIGIKTTPTLLGVKIIDKKLFVSNVFKVYAFGIKIIHIIIAMLPFLFRFTSMYIDSLPIQLIFFIILSIIILYLLVKILLTPLSKRNKMLIYEGLQEGFSYLLVPTVYAGYLIEHLGFLSTILLIVFMIIWPLTCFRILFGKKMIPFE